LRLRLKEPMDGSSLIFCGIEFQIVGAANLKALRPTALAVEGICNSSYARHLSRNYISEITLIHMHSIFRNSCA